MGRDDTTITRTTTTLFFSHSTSLSLKSALWSQLQFPDDVKKKQSEASTGFVQGLDDFSKAPRCGSTMQETLKHDQQQKNEKESRRRKSYYHLSSADP